MNDFSDQTGQTQYPLADSMWLCLSNVCDKGKFKITLEINGEPFKEWCQYVEQDEGVLCESWNLTHWLKTNNKEISLLRKVADATEDYMNSVCPILNLDCEVTGTCKGCLEDGRGTHTEQAEHAQVRLDKALKAWREVKGG